MEFGTDPIKYLQKQRKLHGDVFCLDLLVTRITFNISPAANALFARKPDAELSFWKMVESRMGHRINEGIYF